MIDSLWEHCIGYCPLSEGCLIYMMFWKWAMPLSSDDCLDVDTFLRLLLTTLANNLGPFKY